MRLPALRNALEARDLKVERLQVEQALDSAATEEQSERGLRQDAQGDGGSEQSGPDGALWSPVASLESEDASEPAGGPADIDSESTTQTSGGNGRLDVLA